MGDTTKRDLVVVGASAGGVEALRNFVSGFPADIDCCVLVVLHVPAESPSVLPAILERAGRLPATHTRDGDPLTPGRIYIAPPSYHMVVHPGRLELSRGPRENGHRPAVDVLFRSAARAYGPRVIATVLSGSLDDGSAGARTVRSCGGLVAVQDPDDALYDSMPRHAIAAAAPDLMAPAAQLGAIVAQHTRDIVKPQPRENPETLHDIQDIQTENSATAFDPDTLADPDRSGTPSGLSCPDCDGPLFEFDHEGYIRFRCRVGHGWSMVSLLARQESSTEDTLWMTLRNLDEKAALCSRLADMARERGNTLTAKRFDESVEETQRLAATIRTLITGRTADIPAPERGPA